jgi:hypothetical protein
MINMAKQLRSYFEVNHYNIDLPFLHKLSNSCCEVTTLAFGNFFSVKVVNIYWNNGNFKVEYTKIFEVG